MRSLFLFIAAVLLFPVFSFAEINGTKHDMTTVIDGLTDPCRACHGGAHHWLPGASGMGRLGHNATDIYTSPTMDHGPGEYTLATVNTIPSDIPLCLSCHDGAYAQSHGLPSFPMGGAADLTADLSDDHPVGFHFNENLDQGIKYPTKAKVTFGTAGDMMWCSSCHNVHDNTYSPFLVTDNTGSALCLDCHLK